MAPLRVTLFSTRRCPACRQARDFLRQRGIQFVELDVKTNLRAQKTLDKLGARSMPVIMIGDTRIDGFDRRKIEQALDER